MGDRNGLKRGYRQLIRGHRGVSAKPRTNVRNCLVPKEGLGAFLDRISPKVSKANVCNLSLIKR